MERFDWYKVARVADLSDVERQVVDGYYRRRLGRGAVAREIGRSRQWVRTVLRTLRERAR